MIQNRNNKLIEREKYFSKQSICLLGGQSFNHRHRPPCASVGFEQVFTISHYYGNDEKLIETFFPEKIARFLDWTLGEGPCDSIRCKIFLVNLFSFELPCVPVLYSCRMLFFNLWLFNHYARGRRYIP